MPPRRFAFEQRRADFAELRAAAYARCCRYADAIRAELPPRAEPPPCLIFYAAVCRRAMLRRCADVAA